jgi:hypothetical protein
MSDPGTVRLPTPQAEAAKAVSDTGASKAADNLSLSDISKSEAAAQAKAAQAKVAQGKADVNPVPEEKSLPETQPLPPDVQAAAEASELPVITVRAQGAETVEEYRKKGKLYFVRVISSSGPPKFYVDNPNAVPPSIMQQLSGPSGVVQPVYFNLADWK